MITALLVTGTAFTTMTPANAACGLECWLSKTFSTNDFVGDWLRDTFGPVKDGGGEDRLMENLTVANKIVSEWKPGEKMLDREMLAKAKPSCKLEQMVELVNKTKSPKALIKNCF